MGSDSDTPPQKKQKTSVKSFKPIKIQDETPTDESKIDENQPKEEERNVVETDVLDTSITFSGLGLDKQLCETCKKLGYKHPTKIQREAIPIALQGRDIIGIAETGSGKTAAFVLPILHLLLNPDNSGKRYARTLPCSALCITPTRELAVQIKEHFDALGSDIGLKTVLLVGGEASFKQAQDIQKLRPHIVVGTPGRIVYHLKQTPGFSVAATKYLVLDEADKLLQSEFDAPLQFILSGMNKKDRRTYLYSATMTKKVEMLKKAHLTNPIKVQVSSSKYSTVATLKQQFVLAPEKYKEAYLTFLLNEHPGKRIVVFVEKNLTCVTLSIALRALGFPCVPIAGKMNEGDRLHCLRKFKSGDRPILIATDVAARGLDIPSVDVVINYDIPVRPTEYIHRVGRAARLGAEGKSITITTQYDIEYFQKIEKLIGKKMELFPSNKEEVLILANTVKKALDVAKKRVKTADEYKEIKEDDDDDDVLTSAVKLVAKRTKKKKKRKRKK